MPVDRIALGQAVRSLAGRDRGRLYLVVGFAPPYILVADGSRPATLDKAIELQSRVESALGDVPFVLALNKADLVHEWRIDAGAVAALERSGWTIFNTSAKVGSGVESLFEALAAKMLEDIGKQVSDAT